MPAPLAMPPIVKPLEPVRLAVFATVSVVMIASAADLAGFDAVVGCGDERGEVVDDGVAEVLTADADESGRADEHVLGRSWSVPASVRSSAVVCAVSVVVS
jgi:hypothetical protein